MSEDKPPNDAEAALDFYDQYLLALGRLCATWAVVDRELNSFLGALLNLTESQIACVATEMNDVAPRCRLAKTLVHTVDVPGAWREDVAELCNVILSHLAPARNRYIHDHFGVDEDRVMKMDRRVKLSKPASFADLRLDFDRTETVDRDDVNNVALRAMTAGARLATARFDLEHLRREGRFPEPPALERSRVAQILQLRFPPDA